MKVLLRPIFFFLAVSSLAFSAPGKPADAVVAARASCEKGDFKEAGEILETALHAPTDQPEAGLKQIAYEMDLIKRVRQDYSLTETQLFQKLSGAVKDLQRTEFDAWVKQGRFDGRMMDGEKRYVGTSVSNLFFRHPELNPRRLPPKNDSDYQKQLLENARAIKMAAARQKKNYVLPTRYRATFTVTAEKNAVPAGKTIRAWLPVPRKTPFQNDFKLVSTSSPVKQLAGENSSIRSVFLEQIAEKDLPTRFQETFEYTIRPTHFNLDPRRIMPVDENDPALKPFLAEAPHVVFTPPLLKLAKKIAGDETNQMLQARAFFNWVADHIKYSYAREYSTLTNISDYCANHGYGDCGQEALLFITLCRSQGIPARWQTGWHLVPGHVTIHDWTEIYLAPYGWVPVDPWAGIFATRYCPSLTPEERTELRN
ncbi:MAG: transglutaminase domain-containing protein, partial [Verrucomicrobiota bacterium]